MASSVGCIAKPEVTYMTLRHSVDKYLVLASDGVWDVISNDQVRSVLRGGAGRGREEGRGVRGEGRGGGDG